MSLSLDWQCLRVEDFFSRHNWTGKKAPSILEPQVLSPLVTPKKQEEAPRGAMAQKAQDLPLSSPRLAQGGGKVKPIPWQCLRVEDFFSQNNWLGKPKELNFQAVIDLRDLAIEENFDPNFDNLPELAPETLEPIRQKALSQSLMVAPSPRKSEEFSLTLSVQDFCEQIEWEGKPAIAVLPEIKVKTSPTKKDEEFTLDDLSGLF